MQDAKNMKNRVVRVSDETWDAAKVIAEKNGTTVSKVIRNFLAAYVKAGAALVLALVAILTLGACGGDEPDTSPVAERTGELLAPVAETPSATPSQAVSAPTEVVQIGVDQVLRIDGQIVGRVKVLSYDPTDNGVAVEINSGSAPLVVDPAAFTLTNADGTTIIGVSSNAAWDVELAASDQTMGQVRFVGATVPMTITYAPEGAEPLVWSL